MKKLFLIISIVTLASACVPFNSDGSLENDVGIEFFRERVEMKITGTVESSYRLNISGIYYFRNPTDVESNSLIYYPFPLEVGFHYPEEITVVEIGERGEESIFFIKAEEGVVFPLRITPNSIITFKVCYSQKVDKPEARYITTTTSAWKKPIEIAEFVVELPVAYRVDMISYQADHIQKGEKTDRYFFKFLNFMPFKDLTVNWSQK
jgi:hypothetical protein